MTILETRRGKIELSGVPQPRKASAGGWKQGWGRDRVRTEIDIRGFREIHWPNREGESFSPVSAELALEKADRGENGISICWPATASLQGLGVRDGETFYLLSAVPTGEGLVRFLSLDSADAEGVRFTFTGAPVEWRLERIDSFKAGAETSEAGDNGNLAESDRKSPPRPEAILWQLGLIDPDGISRVPADRGFDVLADAAARIRALETSGEAGNTAGTGAAPTAAAANILHVFGYAAGHDRGYPDYTPSAALGGTEALRHAVEAVNEEDFAVSLYMNARLAERQAVESDSKLAEAAMQGSDGLPVIETYRGREFVVMNPESAAWRDRLILEAGLLASTGAEWIQLDQVAGRAAPVAPGAPWGAGYRKLIADLQNLGVKVWLQGVSDYYPADAFEATWRQVNILDDGTLRGGCPFGEPDTSLLEAAKFDGSLIVPTAKAESLSATALKVIRDANARADHLPLWSESWPLDGATDIENYSRITGENGGSI